MKKIIINQAKESSFYNLDTSTFSNLSAIKDRIQLDAVDIDLLNASIFFVTNLHRESNNLILFKNHSILNDMAMLHSAQMSLQGFFSHKNPTNIKYNELSDRIKAITQSQRQYFSCLGENIADYPLINSGGKQHIVKNIFGGAKIFSEDGSKEILPYTYEEFAITIVNGWMNSKGHRENILNPAFNYLGCGATFYKKELTNNVFKIDYCKATQNFGGKIIQNDPTYIKNSFKIKRIIS